MDIKKIQIENLWRTWRTLHGILYRKISRKGRKWNAKGTQRTHRITSANLTKNFANLKGRREKPQRTWRKT